MHDTEHKQFWPAEVVHQDKREAANGPVPKAQVIGATSLGISLKVLNGSLSFGKKGRADLRTASVIPTQCTEDVRFKQRVVAKSFRRHGWR